VTNLDVWICRCSSRSLYFTHHAFRDNLDQKGMFWKTRNFRVISAGRNEQTKTGNNDTEGNLH